MEKGQMSKPLSDPGQAQQPVKSDKIEVFTRARYKGRRYKGRSNSKSDFRANIKQSPWKNEQGRKQSLDDILEGEEEYKRRAFIQNTFNQGRPFQSAGGVLVNPAFLPNAQSQEQTQFPFNYDTFGMNPSMGMSQNPMMGQMAPYQTFGKSLLPLQISELNDHAIEAPMTFGGYMPSYMTNASPYMPLNFMSPYVNLNYQSQPQMSHPIRAIPATAAEVEADTFLSNLADELPAPKSLTQTETLEEPKREEEVGIEPSVSEQVVDLGLEEGEVDPIEELPSPPCYNCLSRSHTLMECKESCGHCAGAGHLTIACERMILGLDTRRESRLRERYNRKDRRARMRT
jgi:hypothetical protein